MYPKFRYDDVVLHKSKRAVGTVMSVINELDRADIRIQGYRYLVFHSGCLWSVPEHALFYKRGRKNEERKSIRKGF